MFEEMQYIEIFSMTKIKTRPRGYNTFFMLNSTEQEILTAHKN